ncbi:MAG: DUF6472 family protein [Clostridiaceae bacterium]
MQTESTDHELRDLRLYTYDEEYGYYVWMQADLDEDEMSAFLRGSDFSCGVTSRYEVLLCT